MLDLKQRISNQEEKEKIKAEKFKKEADLSLRFYRKEKAWQILLRIAILKHTNGK